jgi:pimeloyl-ACP methyl ester carboxylesterase
MGNKLQAMRAPKQLLQGQELFFEPGEVTLRCDATRVANQDAPQRHCILLHGWNSPSWYMNGIGEALRALPKAAGWHFWSVDYKTHWRSFAASARDIGAVMRDQPHDFSHTVFVGFSMGGLVARQMVADGFRCHALLTIATPHGGTAPWVPPHSPGTWALSRWSTRLRALNANPADKACRRRYHFFAVTYRDRLGYHDDDSIVTARSALGANLGPIAQRKKIQLNYGQELGRRVLGSPHARGMNPRLLQPLFDTCATVFSTSDFSTGD